MIPATQGTSAASKLLETSDIQSRLKKIKLLILDVDGVMTDGRVFWLAGHGWTRNFHIKDGYGIKLLMASGIDVAIISGGESEDVRMRMQFLKIKHVFLGDEDKLKALEKIVESTGLALDQMAFMGDDLFDLPVLERVGFSASVPHAVDPVRARVHYVTENPGGWGAVREIADAIRKSQGLGPYLT
jgi:3-deoxy-D-manno-octulosonate 8-phosphate phosphatase (KDO 8-P phosphatase)